MAKFETAAEFVADWAAGRGTTPEALAARGRIARECGCGGQRCPGWYLSGILGHATTEARAEAIVATPRPNP